MNAKNELASAFDGVLSEFQRSPAITFILEGRLRLEHYKSMLREIFHYAREDPQIQALAAVYFRGVDRSSVKTFFKHATSEVGHDQLALADLRVCGDDPSEVPFENPLPTTIALSAFPFYLINYRNPVGYLGYLYFLEHVPTRNGELYAKAFSTAGIPRAAMTFLHEHVTVDVAHNALMERYVDTLVRSRLDIDEVIYTMRVTGTLYAQMLWGAIKQADEPKAYGVNGCETARR